MSALSLKTPPYSVHSERTMLGVLLREPDLIGEIGAIIPDGRAFFRDHHGRLYDLMRRLAAEAGGAFTDEALRAALPAALDDELAARALLGELATATGNRDRAIECARTVQDKARLRRLIDTLSELLYDSSRTADSFPAVLARVRAKIEALGEA